MMEQDQRATAKPWLGVLETPWGWAGAAGAGPRLLRILLPRPGGKGAVLRDLSRLYPEGIPGGRGSRTVLREIGRLLAGKGKGPKIDLTAFPPFMREALGWIARIPRGRVASYGRVAAWMDHRGAARAVGRASARNPVPLVVPCHRVVGSDGRLVGFSTRGGTSLKHAMLLEEGVGFRGGAVPRVEARFQLRAAPGGERGCRIAP
ncbi:MAG: methylated-DNA--[protein]-cysteine S-methyltransferase [Planctomycetota bacterium]|jgi:methylated-DNA-[protein]-cysteine S-methyltransferase